MKRQRIDRQAATILVIEADPLLLTALGAMIDMNGHRAVLARTEEVAMQALEHRPIDVIVLSMEQLESGCAFADHLRSNQLTREIPIIYLVPEQTPAWAEQLRSRGGVYSLLKPYQPDSLWELIERTLWMPHVAHARVQPPRAPLFSQRDWISLG